MSLTEGFWAMYKHQVLWHLTKQEGRGGLLTADQHQLEPAQNCASSLCHRSSSSQKPQAPLICRA